MSTGTRIGLALVTILVTILVVYYGFIMRPSDRAALDRLPVERASDPMVAGDAEADVPVAARREAAPVEALERTAPPRAPGRVSSDPSLLAQRPGRLDSTGEPDDQSDLDPLGATPSSPQAAPDADRTPATRSTERANEGVVMGRPETPRIDVPRPAWETHVVRSGDTLSSIAGAWFGDESKWDLIAEVNDDVDPNRLRIGQVLRLPPRSAVRVAAGPPASSERYTVRAGDTLSTIAARHYGSHLAWERLHDANRGVIGDDPARLAVGMVLVVPR